MRSIVMNIPNPTAELLVFGRTVVTKYTNNIWVPNPNPTLPTTSQHLDDLETAEVLVQTGKKGAAKARNDAKVVVRGDLGGLASCAVQAATLNPGKAGTIYEALGWSEKTVTRPHKAPIA